MAVYSLNYQTAGKVVHVELSHASDVLLMDSINYNAYRRGAQCTYYGGHYTQSPVRISIPRPAVWHLVVEGAHRASVQVVG